MTRSPLGALCVLGGGQPRYSLAEGPASAASYARHGLAALGVAGDAGEVEYLDAGVMNYVYRVRAAGRTFYLKQALALVKEHHRLGPDLAGVSPARIRADYRALALLAQELAEEHRAFVPPPTWYDQANNVLWTEEVLPGARSLHTELQHGRFSEAAAERLGELLGAIHSAGMGEAPPLWPSVEEDHANWDRFLHMRTTGVLPRAALPPEAEAAAHALRAEARSRQRPGMLSHLDLAPKNVLVDADDRVGVLDFELGASVSDPAYDPGFLIGHYLLMGANCGRQADAGAAAARVAGGYRRTGPDADAEWPERVNRYAGLTMLYRLYGSSPAPYLAPERYTVIREEGLALLVGQARAVE